MIPHCLNVLGLGDKENREENNFYATDEIAVDKLLEKEKDSFIGKKILEPCCGSLNISNRLKEVLGPLDITNIDIVNRGWEDIVGDYLEINCKDKYDLIITNPPYTRGNVQIDIVLKAIDDVKDGGLVFMFLKTLFLESQKRYERIFSKYPPKKIYVFSKRINCYKCNDRTKKDSSAISYSWFVWEKGYKGATVVDWLP